MSKVIENCVKVNNCSEYYLKRKDKVRVKDLWNDVHKKCRFFVFDGYEDWNSIKGMNHSRRNNQPNDVECFFK